MTTTENIIERLVPSQTCTCSECEVAREAAERLRALEARLSALTAEVEAERASTAKAARALWPDSNSIAARHQAHYRQCECVGDSSECCDATCPCHPEDAS